MLKIIELEIDPSLSADTGVFEIALVEFPAIEEELIFFGRQKFYKATEEVSSRACRAIKENEKRGNPAGTQVGKVRAQQLCNRDEISLETVRRMKSYLERAETYYTGDYDDNGTISYDLWGGKPALEWVNRILNSIEKTEEEMEITPNPCWEGYEPIGLKPDGSPNCVPIEQSRQEFVYPTSSETRDEFIGRCMGDSQMVGEFPQEDQRTAVCYSYWERRGEFSQDRIGFEWNVLKTPQGRRMFEQELMRGLPVIFVQGYPDQELRDFIREYRIPITSINMYNNPLDKVRLVQVMGIKRHYDNNLEVRRQLGRVSVNFDYDVTGLPDYQVTTGGTMEIKTETLSDCGCKKEEEFNLLGFIDGLPVFSSSEEAEIYGESIGCDGHHTHVDEDGEVMYMPCEVHPTPEDVYDFSKWDKEDLEIKEHFDFIRQTQPEEFERILNPLLRGYTEQEIYSMNLKRPTKFYLYEKVDSGEPTRQFCESIEGRYFRISQIYALQDRNTEFGHNRQPYSKWMYKGGPNCVHAWHEYTFLRRQKTDEGMAKGTPGIPPKRLPNNGYFSPETKRRSEVAYIIEQKQRQGMSRQDFELIGEFEPLGWNGDYPLYIDGGIASDVSYLLGCGGITEQVEYGDRMVFQACSFKGKKTDLGKEGQMFASVPEKRMIYTPLMIPNILIPRVAEDGERYFVKFTPETIEMIQQKFMLEQRLRSTNYEHTNRKFNDVVMVESWIVEGDMDKAYQLGFTKEQIPVGTWFGGFKVLETPEGEMIWNELIKPRKVKGASVEGNFLLNFSQVTSDEYLLKTIINILNNIED